MGIIIQRGIMPALLLACGIASLVYGVKYHTKEIFHEEEIEISLAPPEMPPPGFEEPGEGDVPPGEGGPAEGNEGEFDDQIGFDDPMGFGGDPGFGPPGGMPIPLPPPETQKIKQTVVVGNEELEPVLVRDSTIGGLKLMPTGELKRTYTGKPPSLCPT